MMEQKDRIILSVQIKKEQVESAKNITIVQHE